MVATCVSPSGVPPPHTDAAVAIPSGPTTNEKCKHRRQEHILEKWLSGHSDNLYPCREEKERLAREMDVTYLQVNRLFANRRRKQTKSRKTGDGVSPPLPTIDHTDSSDGLLFHNDVNPATNHTDKSWLSESNENVGQEDMVVHASLPETGATALSDAMTGSETLIGPDGQNRSNLLSSFHRVPDLHCKMASPSSMIPNQQRCPINTMFDSKFPTVPASYVPNQLTAAALAAAASRANNPLWLAAALGMQAGSPIPWMTSPQMLASVFPYLQQIQAQAQQAAIAQQILAAQQSGSIASPPQVPTSVPTTPPAMNAVVQQLPQQWLSPPPSAAPMPIQTSSSPQLLSGGESPSTLSDLSDFSPRPCSDVISPPKVPSSSPTSSFLDPDLLLDAIIEERKDLSEEESIAVAVLAGMAYQR